MSDQDYRDLEEFDRLGDIIDSLRYERDAARAAAKAWKASAKLHRNGHYDAIELVDDLNGEYNQNTTSAQLYNRLRAWWI